MQEPPNIVLLLADDLGAGSLGYAVADRLHVGAGNRSFALAPPDTPHLDAMAKGRHTLLMHRFYAGSAVCSPARAALLTGRAADRECVFASEGCGGKPAWACPQKQPLPLSSFTLAMAAKQAGYATIHIGKWHLGDMFLKSNSTRQRRSSSWEREGTDFSSYDKWPVSHPGMHGFDQWFSTPASAATTTPNCGCDKAWVAGGCVSGGGEWAQKAPSSCTNYWQPSSMAAETPACRVSESATRDCVSNLTAKIGELRESPDTGDDTEYMLNLFEGFLDRRSVHPKPFLAALWLHTPHAPTPALPRFYHAYNAAIRGPNGDYLGTISQMDEQLGRLGLMLRDRQLEENTLIWFSSDNGPVSTGAAGKHEILSLTNGLRQCKGSLFEGGIRSLSFITWPAAIRSHMEMWAPAAAYDILPTLLDAMQTTYPNPHWARDGVSLLPRIKGSESVSSPRQPTKPICFALGEQTACIDNQWKIIGDVINKGACDWNDGGRPPPYSNATAGEVYRTRGTYLFNLNSDPTESVPLNNAEPERFHRYSAYMANWRLGLLHSQEEESKCRPVGSHLASPSSSAQRAHTRAHLASAFKSSPSSSPQTPSFRLKQNASNNATCLRIARSVQLSPGESKDGGDAPSSAFLQLGICSGTESRWDLAKLMSLQTPQLDRESARSSLTPNSSAKSGNVSAVHRPCAKGVPVTMRQPQSQPVSLRSHEGAGSTAAPLGHAQFAIHTVASKPPVASELLFDKILASSAEPEKRQGLRTTDVNRNVSTARAAQPGRLATSKSLLVQLASTLCPGLCFALSHAGRQGAQEATLQSCDEEQGLTHWWLKTISMKK